MERQYSVRFFDAQEGGSKASAKLILPLIFDSLQVSSVLDVGCGTGGWLTVCRDLGATECVGVDGANSGGRELNFPGSKYIVSDLNKPLRLNRKFDLVISVEVGEHLNPASSKVLVDTLATHSDVVLFSAAIPFQGGEHHVNEQWQSYWAELFVMKKFLPVDFVRSRIWQDESVEAFYAQNLLLYVNSATLDSYPRFRQISASPRWMPLDVVHPRVYLATATNPFRLGVLSLAWRSMQTLRRKLASKDNISSRPP